MRSLVVEPAIGLPSRQAIARTYASECAAAVITSRLKLDAGTSNGSSTATSFPRPPPVKRSVRSEGVSGAVRTWPSVPRKSHPSRVSGMPMRRTSRISGWPWAGTVGESRRRSKR